MVSARNMIKKVSTRNMKRIRLQNKGSGHVRERITGI